MLEFTAGTKLGLQSSGGIDITPCATSWTTLALTNSRNLYSRFLKHTSGSQSSPGGVDQILAGTHTRQTHFIFQIRISRALVPFIPVRKLLKGGQRSLAEPSGAPLGRSASYQRDHTHKGPKERPKVD